MSTRRHLRDERDESKSKRAFAVVGAIAAIVVVVAAGLAVRSTRQDDRVASQPAESETTSSAVEPSTTTTIPVPTSTPSAPSSELVWADPATSGTPWNTTTRGLIAFRGNPTRTFTGTGPIATAPAVTWTYPQTSMCADSTVGDETKQWCGSGWTGQPSVFEYGDRTLVAFGAYDRNVHLLDANTGAAFVAPYPTGDIIKGSVSIDPDGYALLYTGSRDNKFRVMSFDRGSFVELWSLGANDAGPTMWNNDWDGNALVIADFLFLGGENSRLHVVRLNRGLDADGFATAAPQLVWSAAGWDDELLAAIGDRNVSFEGSVMMSGDTLYAANSGGLVQGWDMSPFRTGVGEPTRTFRYWAGDDTDATLVGDVDGTMYVATEVDRGTARGAEVGQVLKLDPSQPEPLVWSWSDPDGRGVWATPALHNGVLFVPTDGGLVVSLDAATGAQLWQLRLPGPLWQSPVIVDDVLVMGDCRGVLHGFDVTDPRVQPPELWNVALSGCIESTPAVWNGRIYVGTRSGRFYAVA